MANQIKKMRQERKWTQEKLSEESGVSVSHISRLETRDRGLTLEQALKIANVFGIEVHDLTDEFINDDLSALPKKLPKHKAKGDVANLDIRAGMGNGGLLSAGGDRVAEEYITGHWSFPDPVKAMWKRLPSTYAFPVVGDSMEPTLSSGDYVFTDTAHQIPSPSDIYAIDYGDGLMIKRVELVPKSDLVRIISDSEHYQNYELPREGLMVFGRVVAWFHWRG